MRLRCPEFNEGKKELEWTTSRLDIDLDNSYHKVLAKIFETVGCDDLKEERLPTVKVHFSKDKKDQEFRLENEKDWEVVKSEWKVEAGKKKEGAYGAVILSKEVT
ncbi:MAG TPA: hypothetical protein VGO47_09645 [Chlamydiales bacterium]|nr:hypothetical protein [Chlamydiales bacterium]